MFAKAAAVLTALAVSIMSALSAPQPRHQDGYPAPATETSAAVQAVGSAPEPAAPTATPQAGAVCLGVAYQTIPQGTFGYCAAWATPTVPYLEGYPAP